LLLMSVIDLLHVSLHSGDSGGASRREMPACGHAPADETGSVTRAVRESHPRSDEEIFEGAIGGGAVDQVDPMDDMDDMDVPA